METKIINPTTIPGWGMDADPKDQPNYPIKKYTGDDHDRKNWQRPTLQPVTVKIFMSTERPYLSAIFGTEVPPSGLSGAIRRFGFRYSENMYRHWLSLLLADRIDVIENFFGDIFHGRIPRLAKERGWKAIGRYRPTLLMRKILIRLIIIGVILFFIIREYYYK
jgi:hypothetical protein